MVQIDCDYVGGCHRYQDFVNIETFFFHNSCRHCGSENITEPCFSLFLYLRLFFFVFMQ